MRWRNAAFMRGATIAAFALLLALWPGLAAAQGRAVVAPAETKDSCRTISPAQQLVLERRALGGDQQAQYVLATCAWLRDVADVSLVQDIAADRDAGRGDPVAVTLTLANAAAPSPEGGQSSTATGVVVRDDIPDGLRLATGEEHFTARLAALAPGDSAVFRYEAELDDPAAFASWRGDVAARSETQRLMGSADLSYRFSPADKILYAYLWSTLAFCDRQFNDLADATSQLEESDRIYRRKKPANDLRQQLRAQLEAESRELNRIRRQANDALYLLEGDPVRESSKAFVEMMDGLGAPGLAALGYMRDCPAYPGVQQRHARAAIWRKASQLIAGEFRVGDTNEYSAGGVAAGELEWLEEIVGDIEGSLSSEDRKSVDRFAGEYRLYDDAERIADLESRGSLALMGKIPVQYLQLALGAFRRHEGYRQGLALEAFTIDNVYGEKTSKLVKQAQENYCVIRDVAVSEDALRNVLDPGEPEDAAAQLPDFSAADDCSRPDRPRARAERERLAGTDYPTGWLTALQSRALICRAAADRQDPYAYMHLAQMFANGWGYAQDFDRAIFAVRRAQRLFSAGPGANPSNYGDLFADDLTTDYREEAEKLEANVYRIAAEILLGREIETAGADTSVRARIDARIARADYDAPGNLCPDQRWKSTFAPAGYAAGAAPAAKFAASRLPVVPVSLAAGAGPDMSLVRFPADAAGAAAPLIRAGAEIGAAADREVLP